MTGKATSWKLSQLNVGRGLPGAGHFTGDTGNWLYDHCAGDHVIPSSFHWKLSCQKACFQLSLQFYIQF